MNKTPSILVDTGFEVDANGVLTEIVTPSVVKTLNAPTKVTFNGTTINWIPSTTAALLEFNAPNVTTITTPLFKGYTALTSISFKNLTTLNNSGTDSGLCRQCTALTSVSMPNLQTVTATSSGYAGAFWGCTALETITLPKLQSVTGADNNGGMFRLCTALKNVQLGSEGNPVTYLQSNVFNACTQSGLTITIYTSGGAALAGEPWGATNATIEYEEA